jgi:hypothetical protein
LNTRAAAQISVPVIGLHNTRATAARCLPRCNHAVLSLGRNIEFVTTAGFINLALNPFGAKSSECFHHKPFNGNAAHA